MPRLAPAPAPVSPNGVLEPEGPDGLGRDLPLALAASRGWVYQLEGRVYCTGCADSSTPMVRRLGVFRCKRHGLSVT